MLSILKSGAKLNKKRDINTNQANFSNIKASKNLSHFFLLSGLSHLRRVRTERRMKELKKAMD